MVLRLPGVVRIVYCSGARPDPEKLRQFARAWAAMRATLARKNLKTVPRGITLVFTDAQKFYARYWSDDVLCVNLETTLKKDPAGILVHELGHRVWFQGMTQRTRGAWGEDHAQKKNAGGAFATGYAKESAIEDHAEHFRLDMQGKLTGAARVRYLRLGPNYKTVRARLGRRASSSGGGSARRTSAARTRTRR